MGSQSSAPAEEPCSDHLPDTSLSSNVTTADENEAKRRRYAHLKSAIVGPSADGGLLSSFLFRSHGGGGGGGAAVSATNTIEQVYNEDFETVDHIQAIRFPPYVAKQIRDAVRCECERRCAEVEKTMARCLQDKMWTSWKCQKERDAYYHCVDDEEKCNTRPSQLAEATTETTKSAEPSVDLLTAYRWKFNLGVLHGEIAGRNNIMRQLWKEHFPDRELPHPWVKDEE